MSILWCGGEDIDFPNGIPLNANTSGSTFRSGFARCSLGAPGSTGGWSNSFSGGGVTSAWLSVQLFNSDDGLTSALLCGLVNNASGNNSGIWIASGSSSAQRLCIAMWNGTTFTQLAVGSYDLFVGNQGSLTRCDLQVVNYGTSSTLNLYVNGGLYCSYTGNSAITGVTTLDSVGIVCPGGTRMAVSELIVASTDTRNYPGLVTLAVNGAGTTDQWTGTFSNINGVSFSDANPAFTNATGQDQQYQVTDSFPISGITLAAVKISARMAAGAGGVPTAVKLGYKGTGSPAFGTGADKTLGVGVGYTTYEQLDSINPLTGVAFTTTDITAPLQLDMQSST
jgi:hypothetical protein